MKKIKIKLVLSFILLIIIVMTNKAQNYSIRSVGYWTSPVLSEYEAKNLSLYKIVIIDGENLVNNPEMLELIKELNSNIKLICYSNPMELFMPMVGPRPIQTVLSKEIREKYPQWLLKTSEGQNVVFYRGMIMLNLSANCPRINGKNCAEYQAEKELEILENQIWDGYFMDNATNTISWVNNKIDSDNNQVPDDSAFLDQAWTEGVRSYLSLIKKGMKKGNLLLGNKGIVEFMDLLDGRIFEKFPNDYLGGRKDGGWHRSMSNARKTGEYTVFLIERKDLMFGLSSALLTDNVYIAISQDNPQIHQEFKVDLGKPLGQAQKNDSCYFRLYQNGKVEVFPQLRKGRITMK